MVNIDLTKALHPKTVESFAPLMPGLFFEISLLLSERYTLWNLSGRGQLGYFTTLAVGLFLAYVIGYAAVVWVRVIQTVMNKCYLKILSFKTATAKTGNQDLYEKELRLVWSSTAMQLLKQGYGIDGRDEEAPKPKYFEAWYLVLGRPDVKYFRGHFLVLASQATGWAGLMAAVVAPVLRNRLYLGFSLLLVLYGLWANWTLMVGSNNETSRRLIQIDAMLSELKAVRTNNRDARNVLRDQESS